jgi:ubiquinone/menaquinone biosynthesis C-methylase UbiE
MKEKNTLKKLDITINDVNQVYSGPIGILWEMLMGDHIHVGGEEETKKLAEKAKISKDQTVLDVCSALGGPARYLAKHYGCEVIGLDATHNMIDEAERRTEHKPYASLITYEFGNAIDMPFKKESFDVVWGQDAWCYITDKNRLIEEAYRVLKPSGTIAFTDWLMVGKLSEKEWYSLNEFMAFPYMETLKGYSTMLKSTGFIIESIEDESLDFADHCHMYQEKLRTELKHVIIKTYGNELFEAADNGLSLWVQAADEGKVGRGRIIAKKQ